MWPLKIKELGALLSAKVVDPSGNTLADREIYSVCTDSRSVALGQVFFALPGDRYDGHDFIESVIQSVDVPCVVTKDWYSRWSRGQETPPQNSFFLVDSTVEALRDLARAFRRRMGYRPVVAVGGSNGKTTTKEMLVCLLGGLDEGIVSTEKSENGFIGIPKTLCHPGLVRSSRAAVVEVGIDEVGAMSQHLQTVQPSVALLTSLAEEHLEGLKDLSTVVAEELILLNGVLGQTAAPPVRVWQCSDPEIRRACEAHLAKQDFVVLPAADPSQDWFVSRASAVLTFTCDLQPDLCTLVEVALMMAVSDRVCEGKSAGLESTNEPVWTSCVRVPMPGAHHARNAALALAAALVVEARFCMLTQEGGDSADFGNWASSLRSLNRQVDVPTEALSSSFPSQSFVSKGPLDQISDRFRRFIPPDLRSAVELYKGKDCDRSLIIDCYNANPSSMRASLDLLNGAVFARTHKILFLGDMLDLGQASAARHTELISILASMPDCQLYLYGKELYPVFRELSGRLSLTTGAPVKVGSLHHLHREEDPEQWVKDFVLPDGPVVILLKGSRGMRLERLLPGLRRILRSS